MFLEQIVFPSPLIEDVNNIVFPNLFFGKINSMFDLIFLNDSVTLDLGFSFTIKSKPVLLLATYPR